jgi:lipid-binding SYLF domain-containing protein
MLDGARARFPGVLLLALAGFTFVGSTAFAQAREEARVLVATQVMEDQRGLRDQFIPDRLLERAFGIAIVPEVKKAAFGLGIRGGKGVLLVRDRDGRFSHPVFVTLGSASFGWQIGVQSTDLILVFTTRSGVDGITDGKITLGADASVAAGPVGRSASAATDAQFTGAEVYSYSRNSGLFAGVALDGAVIAIDKTANSRYYGGRRVPVGDIISGSVKKDSESVRRLLNAVTVSTRTRDGAASPAAPAPTAPEVPTAPAAPAPADSGTRTFPMEDAKPGQEPPR